MDIVVKSRNTDIDKRFRDSITEKLTRLAKLDRKADRVDVEIAEERNPRLSDLRMRVELTCRTRGPVIRAEASAADEQAALDLAIGKLNMRLRRAADRRRVHHGARTPVSVALATGSVQPPAASAAADAEPPVASAEPPGEPGEPAEEDEAPYVVREKIHLAAPMSLDQALFEMELVGHDFYLFVDEGDQAPCVVYRRRGYDYGVVRLHEPEKDGQAPSV
ncbi:MAG TPA: ribosome-associated translation inhibitor RaiA [Mycobacteriales bacterium]|nr:ribosome-associated translation inhibitor RaiA [Mycobacteriales bacterium]